MRFLLHRSLCVSIYRRFINLSWKSLIKICTVLLLLGICCTTWIANLPTTTQILLERHKRSITPPKHRVFKVSEILNFPKNYHAKGVLSLPYGNIVEPFEAWYSGEHKMSRIDYYGGMDQTYQRESLGKHGFACKVVPEFSENTQKNFRGCLHRRGTKHFPVKAQSIVPKSHYFKYIGDVTLRGHRAAKWQHKFTIYNKVNTYILYTTKSRNVKPLRYEMMGYDTLLSSYYDHYVLDYEIFEAWKFNYSTFEIPTDLDCFDFAPKKFVNIVGELNPMLEFMPHTDNGAPFTFSHEPHRADESRKEALKRMDSQSETMTTYPSEGLDASLDHDGSRSEDRIESPILDNDQVSQKNNKISENSRSTLNFIPQTSSIKAQKSNYEKSNKKTNWETSTNSHVQNRLSYNDEYNRFFSNRRKKDYLTDLSKNKKSKIHKSVKNYGFPKKRKIKSRNLTKEMDVEVHPKTHVYSWGKSGGTKHKIDSAKKHILDFKHFSMKKTKQKKHGKSTKKSHENSGEKANVDSMLRKNYEDIVNLLFDAFKLDQKKAYSSGHEHETRKDIYRHNLRFIMSRNRMHLGYKLRPNHLMDMTDNEIQKQKGLLKEDDVFNGGIPFEPMSRDIPEAVDWRQSGAVNPVKSQGICGSCYAYAVTGALEGAYFLKNGHLPDFSEQEIIDCSWGFGNRGCKGGYPYRAMQWILKHGGLATEDSYGKYLAQEGYCHFKNVSVGVTVESYMNISKGNVTELKQALAQYGPVSVLINTRPKSFKFYSSGIYYDPECGSNLDHAALAVGYGVQNKTPYWLIKNSWSRAWGNSGYIKVAQRDNNCGVTSKAVVVKIRYRSISAPICVKLKQDLSLRDVLLRITMPSCFINVSFIAFLTLTITVRTCVHFHSRSKQAPSRNSPQNRDTVNRPHRGKKQSTKSFHRGEKRKSDIAFPKSYHATGLLTLPYDGIMEPFEMWYAEEYNMSRIDYYHGVDKTFQRGDLDDYGIYIKEIPVHRTKLGHNNRHSESCWYQHGKSYDVVKAQSIVPMDLTHYKVVGEEYRAGTQTIKLKRHVMTGKLNNTYKLWVTKAKPHRPIRYETEGFDLLLRGYYDHYYLDYVSFRDWKFDFGIMQIPKGSWCYNISLNARSRYIVNPMSEFVHESHELPKHDKHLEHSFSHFKRKHNKTYKDKEEHTTRRNIYRHNARYIRSKNRARLNYTLALNPLADLTPAEFRLMDDLLDQPDEGMPDSLQDQFPKRGEVPIVSYHRPSQPPPEALDWREYDVQSPIRGQSMCGSCWAFSTVGMLEGAYKIATGRNIQLSAQMLLDCTYGYRNYGCRGGWPWKAMKWVINNGIATKESYGRYLAQEGLCHCGRKENCTMVYPTSFGDVVAENRTAMMINVATYGPVSVGINSKPKSFKFYRDGVYDDQECDDHTQHSLIIVGYGQLLRDGFKYWVIKNSWGPYWGRKGYMRIASEDDTCGILASNGVVGNFRNNSMGEFPFQRMKKVVTPHHGDMEDHMKDDGFTRIFDSLPFN